MNKTIIAGGIGILAVAFVIALVLFVRHLKTRGAANKLASRLKSEKTKSDILLNAIEDGVVVIDDKKTIQLFNPAATSITGWPLDEAMGIDYHSVLKFVDDKNVEYTDEQHPITKVFKEPTSHRDSHAFLVSREGKRIAVSISVSPLMDDQVLNGIVAIFRDVSQERTEEAQRAEFISTASHEMRTPVAAIEGYLALALNDKVSTIDTKARAYLEKAHLSTQHLGKLFQDLLTSAKAEDGRLTNHPYVVEMGEFIEKLTEDLRFTAEKKGLTMEFVMGSTADVIDARETFGKVVRPLYYAQVDPDRMREVITNIFDNAVKYTETGKVSLGITGDDTVVQIRVMDTGSGIPREDIPHLFQKFYRVDNSITRTIGGTGLGLFISKKIVELYNGRIWVTSEVGKGSTFYINLPRLSTQQAAQLQSQEAARGDTRPSDSLTKI